MSLWRLTTIGWYSNILLQLYEWWTFQLHSTSTLTISKQFCQLRFLFIAWSTRGRVFFSHRQWQEVHPPLLADIQRWCFCDTAILKCKKCIFLWHFFFEVHGEIENIVYSFLRRFQFFSRDIFLSCRVNFNWKQLFFYISQQISKYLCFLVCITWVFFAILFYGAVLTEIGYAKEPEGSHV